MCPAGPGGGGWELVSRALRQRTSGLNADEPAASKGYWQPEALALRVGTAGPTCSAVSRTRRRRVWHPSQGASTVSTGSNGQCSAWR